MKKISSVPFIVLALITASGCLPLKATPKQDPNAGVSEPASAAETPNENTGPVEIGTQTEGTDFRPGLGNTDYDQEVRKAGEAVRDRALKLVSDAKKWNRDDLNYLFNSLTSDYELRKSEGFKRLKVKAVQKIESEQKALLDLQKRVGIQGSFPFKTSLVKLLGTTTSSGFLSKIMGNNKTPGILDEALARIDQADELWNLNPSEPEPSHHEITVLKTTLLYLGLAAEKINWDESLKKLQFLYPAEVPECKDWPKDQTIALCPAPVKGGRISPETLLVPNAGYIFGGSFQGDTCRGSDCSAQTSYLAEAGVRLSTYHYEVLWKELKGLEDSRDSVVKSILKKFYAIEPKDVSELLPGDTVVWRAQNGKSGHSAIVVQALENSTVRFLGVDTTRKDDKTLEGIYHREFDLFQTQKNTFVLRKAPN